MASLWIDIGNEGLRGFLALPPAGSGPGLLMLPDVTGVDQAFESLARTYAEEGYVVVAPDLSPMGRDDGRLLQEIAVAFACLRTRPECTGSAGVLGFGVGGRLAWLAAAELDVQVAVAYAPTGIPAEPSWHDRMTCPVMLHLGEVSGLNGIRDRLAKAETLRVHVYPGCGTRFYAVSDPAHDKSASLMAYSRTIEALRSALGPDYDLSALWEEHTFQEFGARDAEATMRSMVAEPYVNHIPTMTGGVGHDELLRFYRHHFIPRTPADTRLIPISRTVGADRLVDEMLFCFTHDIEMDWMLPGIAPTGRYVEVPLVAIVRFRGDKLYNEHIYWDQASVLVQVGRLDPEGLPVAGAETARKLLDESAPSNTLMARWQRSA